MITKEQIPHPLGPVDADGNAREPYFHYTWTPEAEGAGVVMTGNIAATIQVADGTVYDTTEAVIEHAPGHGDELAEKIRALHHTVGKHLPKEA